MGQKCFLPLSTLPPLEGNRFYYHEVIGFDVFDEAENFCGSIKEINDQAAQHYFILNNKGKEVIIPIIKDWILKVNRDEKIISMQLPEGLLEVFEV
ncbi:PRC-barrel domain-containing protein [Riemerella anatipestifer]|nr:PRC-barrel domain-containing protein [Riemerella anatipestifer]